MQKHPHLPQAFADLGVEVRFLKALAKMGFTEPSDIQRRLVPDALTSKDILGQARTGTGKTAAFGLPVLQQLDPAQRLQAICLVPTRELAVQVTAELKRIAEFANLHIVSVYGGQKVATQLHQLGRKPHLVVGTPGRVMDFMSRGVLSVAELKFVVLDEVDRMLDIGFRDDIRRILGAVTAPHQTIFVSATIDDEIKRLAMKYMRDPIEINVSQDRLTVDEVQQSYVTAEPRDKFRLLRLLLGQHDPAVAIVFCNTKHGAHKLAKKLHDAGIQATEIHGDLIQRKRDRVMDQFRKHQIQVLVATDLAARGIDVSAVSHIYNYDLPQDPQIYVHRIGRTARMGAQGVAVSFVTREEGKELTAIEALINREVPAMKVDGFAATPVMAEEPRQRVEPPMSRFRAPASTDSTTVTARPKTLGGKFRPKRSRRRL
jgi:ATP-dependent RNA helicase DeaD